jgi:hypothetical protein
MVPKDFRGKDKIGNAIVAMQMGYELGLPPLQALQNIAVVNGRPALWGDAIPALVRSAPDFEDMIETSTPTEATCEIRRRGLTPVKVTFTEADAKRAGLWGKNVWAQFPQRMLLMRARGFAARDAYADRLKGLAIAEEQGDVHNDRPTPSEPRRVGHGSTVPAADPAATTPATSETPTQDSPAATSAAPASPTNGGAQLHHARGVQILDVTYIGADTSKKQPGHWCIRTSADGDAGPFITSEDAIGREAETCAGSDHLFAVAYTVGRRKNNDVARVLKTLTLDEGAGEPTQATLDGGEEAQP